MIFQHEYLRVLKPVTSGGVNPVYDESGRPTYKEYELPITALADLQRENQNRPDHLKFKIERVSPNAIKSRQTEPDDEPAKKAGRPAKNKDENQ